MRFGLIESVFYSHRVVSKPKKIQEYYKMVQLLSSVPQTGELNPDTDHQLNIIWLTACQV